MKAIVWGRFSSDQQEDGDSEDRQNRLNRACAKRRGIETVQEYFDRGTSVKDGPTPLFLEIIATLPPDVGIICENLDRISRGHPWMTKPFIFDLINKGHFIITSKDDKLYNKDNINALETIFTGDIFAGIAYTINKDRTERSKSGLNKLIEKTRNHEKVSLGAWMPKWISFDKKLNDFVYDEDRVAIVKRIYKEYIIDESGTPSIAGRLNLDNKPSFRQNGKWSNSSVRQILLSPCVYGDLVIKGEVIPNVYKPIISWDDFCLVQARMKSNGKRHGNWSGTTNNLFRGIIFCSKCQGGIGVHPRRTKNGRTLYYHCISAAVKRCTHNNFLRIENVDLLFLNWFLRRFSLDPTSSDINNELQSVKGELLTISKGISNLLDLMESGLDVSEVKTRLNKLNTRKIDLDNRRIELEGKRVSDKKLPDSIKELGALVLSGLNDEDTRRKIMIILPQLIRRIELNLVDESFEIEMTNGRFEIFKEWEHEGEFME